MQHFCTSNRPDIGCCKSQKGNCSTLGGHKLNLKPDIVDIAVNHCSHVICSKAVTFDIVVESNQV